MRELSLIWAPCLLAGLGRAQAVLLMTDHNRYKYFTQRDIDSLGIRNASLIIDNVALFRDFKFSPKTIYHLVGDGKMGNIK